MRAPGPNARRRIVLLLIVFALPTITFTAGCRLKQVPADGDPYRTRLLGERYALVFDRNERPCGVWDLSYPHFSRHHWEKHHENFVGRCYPQRLVNYRNTLEMKQIRHRERWRVGVKSWLGAMFTFGVMKWVVTVDYFDTRELRMAHRAMMRQYLIMFPPDYGAFKEAGLAEWMRSAAIYQLHQIDERTLHRRVTENTGGRLREEARDDLAELMDEVADRCRDILQDPDPYRGPFNPSAWARLKQDLPPVPLPKRLARMKYPASEVAYAQMHAAAEALEQRAQQVWISTEQFDEKGHFALVTVHLRDMEMPLGVYEVGFDTKPRLVLPLIDPFRHGPFQVGKWWSLTVNEIGAVVVFVTDRFLTGLPVPVVGLTLNTITSIWPTAPFRGIDKLAWSRGRLLVLLRHCTDRAALLPVPALLVQNRDELIGALEHDMLKINRYWLTSSQRSRLIELNRRKLVGGEAGTIRPSETN